MLPINNSEGRSPTGESVPQDEVCSCFAATGDLLGCRVQALLAVLLPKHAGCHLCCGLERHRPDVNSKGRVPCNFAGKPQSANQELMGC